MTLEIKSDRRNLTFGSGEPAISHEKAIEIVKALLEKYFEIYGEDLRKKVGSESV